MIDLVLAGVGLVALFGLLGILHGALKARLLPSRSDEHAITRVWTHRQGYAIEMRDDLVRFEAQAPKRLVLGAAAAALMAWGVSAPALAQAFGLWAPATAPSLETTGSLVLFALVFLALGLLAFARSRRRLTLVLEERGPLRLTWYGMLGELSEREVERAQVLGVRQGRRSFFLEHGDPDDPDGIAILTAPDPNRPYQEGSRIEADLARLSEALQGLTGRAQVEAGGEA